MVNILSTIINKNDVLGIGDGLIYSIVSILLVFTALLIIIGVTSLITKSLNSNEETTVNNEKKPITSDVEIKDDDMMAAVLVATIEYRKESKKDVRVKSIKEIK
jgi:Na+-transporting methylmalonyl-CoA/oxaloacetate decarboxylase gamma subunit